MKTLPTSMLVALLILLTQLTFAQAQPDRRADVEVLMIGTSHEYNMTTNEKFSEVINKAVAFRPDAVFGETLTAEDYDAIPDYWNKARMEKRFAYLKSIPFAGPKDPDKFIRQTIKLLRTKPNYHQERMKLARALYLKHDYGNARYQLYRLDKARPAFGAEEIAAYQAILGVPDSLYKTRNNEYHNMAFPLVQQVGLDEILSMDSQRHDMKWSAAWERADSLVKQWEKGVEKDSTSAAARQYAGLTKRTADLQKAVNAAEKAGNDTEFFNSPDGDEYLNIVNFYGARRMFGAEGFPDKAVDAMLAEWQNRNDDMVRNTVARARQIGAKRVVVFVGANHRKIMVDGLRATPGVTVRSLND
jgi:Family of unknown function (DUF5694)